MDDSLKRTIIKTSDGSTTIHFPEINEQYHSKHGAINEARHVFIRHGLQYRWQLAEVSRPLDIVEIGFGTGLNAFITFLEALKEQRAIQYTGVEAYPVTSQEVASLNYVAALEAEQHRAVFDTIHAVDWEVPQEMSASFLLTKRQQLFQEITDKNCFDLVYFDAFGARVQPELWSETIFGAMYTALRKNGVLVTYAAKGSVRRAMQSVGFEVERLPGPPGKREMLRGVKR